MIFRRVPCVPRIIKRLKRVFLRGKTRVVSRSIIRNQFPLPFRTYASRTERNLIYISISRIPPAHPVPFRSNCWNLDTVPFHSGYWNLASVPFQSLESWYRSVRFWILESRFRSIPFHLLESRFHTVPFQFLEFRFYPVPFQKAIAWVEYLSFNLPRLHTWKIYSKKDDMELSFFDRRYFFNRIITTTM